MATVSNVSLAITTGTDANSKSVTVAGTLNFQASDIGKQYRLAIKLFGKDAAGDNLPGTDSTGDDELYTFSFITFFALLYKPITVTVAGAQAFSETRQINKVTLDEDSGNIIVPPPFPGIPPLQIPRLDEIYAKATLSLAPSSSSAQSNTVTGFY